MGLSFKQGSFLYSLTGRKFWELRPVPSQADGSRVLSLCVDALFLPRPKDADGKPIGPLVPRTPRDEGLIHMAADAVRKYFPDFRDEELKRRFFKRKAKSEVTTPEEPEVKSPSPTPNPESPPEATPPPARDDIPDASMPTPEPFRGGKAEPEPAKVKTEPIPKPEPPKEPAPEPPKAKEPEPATEPKSKPKTTKLLEDIRVKIRAGLKQLFIAGPAGCGKTACSLLAAEAEGKQAVLVACNLGTPAHTFTGRTPAIDFSPILQGLAAIFPQAKEAIAAIEARSFDWSAFLKGYEQDDTLIILDEFPQLDASVAACINGALANGHITGPNGLIIKRGRNTCVVTANVWGHGADRQYIGNSQLDAATLDRFAGGRISAEYDQGYERQYDAEVVAYCWKARRHVESRGLRRIVSTRMIQNCSSLKSAGLDWREQVTMDWSDSERSGFDA